MSWDSVQQVVRIILYALGGYFFGEGVTDSSWFQQAVGGVLAVGSFAWWMIWDRSRETSD